MAGKHEGPVNRGERAVMLAYVPAARRAALAALWALDDRLGGIVAAAREPMIGRIRLAWWRDALVALDAAPPPAEPLLAELAARVLPVVAGAELAAMVAGWDALLPLDSVDAEATAIHAAERGERLFALSGRLLGGVPPAGAGAGWALAELSRMTGRPRDRAEALVAPGRWPGALRPLGMRAILAARNPAEREGSPARLLAMLRHRLTGR